MKFVYVDEAGDQDQGDVFVMAGVLIDAYGDCGSRKLR
jgi:hypothetical protein